MTTLMRSRRIQLRTQQMSGYTRNETRNCGDDCRPVLYDPPVSRVVCCRRATRGASSVLSRNYAQSKAQLMRKRAQTYKQNQYAFVDGEGNYRGQNSEGCGEECQPTISYKPNNRQYAQQGAVNSDTRTERLKYVSISSREKYLTNRLKPVLNDSICHRNHRNGNRNNCD
jgi:hypothetical protein